MKTEALTAFKKAVYPYIKYFLPNASAILSRRIFREYLRAIRINGKSDLRSVVLPANYGIGMPERVMEILLARLSVSGPGLKVLDVGHANAMKCHLNMIRALPRADVTGIDIARPRFNFGKYYQTSLQDDVLSSALPDNSFDLVWVISTLEHIGMDNSGYSKSYVIERGAAVRVLRNLLRVVAPQGHALVTVPYGEFQDFGWQINYDYEQLQALVRTANGLADVDQMFFAHTERGWKRTEPDMLRHVKYYDEGNKGAAAIAVLWLTKTAT
jgi:SAM-dependent methyltransferase